MKSYTELAELYEDAVQAILLGAQSYTIGARTVTRANLADVERLAAKYRGLAQRYESSTSSQTYSQRIVPHDC